MNKQIQIPRRNFLATFIASSLYLSNYESALASNFPSQPIKMVVGFAAGGATDLLTRLVCQKISEKIGQQIVIENKIGAGGSLGTDFVAKSLGDGHTLLSASASHTINQSLYKSLPYDPVADFEPISMIGGISNILVVSPSLQVSSVSELISYVKNNPNKVNIASAGIGSSSHLAGELFQSIAGLKLTHVPYKGTAESVRDLLSGEVQVTIDALPVLLPHIKKGSLKALGVGDKKRISLLPDVPTLSEAGITGYELYAWVGFLAPAKTAKDIISILNLQINNALKLPEVQKKFADMGAFVSGTTPEEFSIIIKNEISKFDKIIKSAGIQAI